MTQTITRRKAGAHRKPGKSIKSRIAMVALTSSAVSVSVSGAAATAAADTNEDTDKAVSYTHLTLPKIYSV